MLYIIKRSNRKTVSIEIDSEHNLLVRCPKHFSEKQLDKIVNDHSDWIMSALEKAKSRPIKSDHEIAELKAVANRVIPEKVHRYSRMMNLYPASVKITSAKKRFGSCSANGNVCFSCFLMLYPDEAIDYVVVHELAHLKEHNHSKRFYAIIKKYLPDYKARIRLLR